ncbi:MAG: tyrosine-type recombinase/integrase [Nitrospirae bacterium]|nr:tyrosine-type recombinase/integrase [Nitrospirota bacterium]
MNTCPTCGACVLYDLKAVDSVNELMTQWINHLEAAGRSYAHIRKLKSNLRHHISPTMGNRDVKTISSKDVFNFYSELLEKNLAGKTIKHIFDALKSLLNHLYDLEVISKIPMFPNIKVLPAAKHWISVETQNQILNHLSSKYFLFIRVLMETGMRPGEARALKLRDIDGTIITVERAIDERGNIRPTKTNKVYRYPVSSGLIYQLRTRYHDYLPETPLFELSKSGIQNAWTRACNIVGTSIPLYQACRHSKASQINEACERDRLCQLQAALQHEHVATTLKYYTLGSKERL